jgi:hypothetical protein
VIMEAPGGRNCVRRRFLICALSNALTVIMKSRRTAGYVLHMGELRYAYRILIGKPKRTIQYKSTRHIGYS